jgi:hypothetical protein
MPEPVLPPAEYERADLKASSTAIVFPLVLLALLAAIMLVHWMFPYAAIDRRLPSTLPDYPAPRLQADPQADMARFLKSELARLNSGGWDDQAKTKGHIPIDDAMRRIAASGIPDWPK